MPFRPPKSRVPWPALLGPIARREVLRRLLVVAGQRLVGRVRDALTQARRDRTRRAANRRSGCWRRGSRAACRARRSRSRARPSSARPPSDCGRRRGCSAARRRAARGGTAASSASPRAAAQRARRAIRRAAARRKWPEPQAGSITFKRQAGLPGCSAHSATFAVDHGVERLLEQELNEGVRGVIAAGCSCAHCPCAASGFLRRPISADGLRPRPRRLRRGTRTIGRRRR